MPDLTNREYDVLHTLITLSRERGYTPTIRELAAALGLKSTCTIHYHLCHLRDKGYITWTKGQNRAIRLIKEYTHD